MHPYLAFRSAKRRTPRNNRESAVNKMRSAPPYLCIFLISRCQEDTAVIKVVLDEGQAKGASSMLRQPLTTTATPRAASASVALAWHWLQVVGAIFGSNFSKMTSSLLNV